MSVVDLMLAAARCLNGAQQSLSPESRCADGPIEIRLPTHDMGRRLESEVEREMRRRGHIEPRTDGGGPENRIEFFGVIVTWPAT